MSFKTALNFLMALTFMVYLSGCSDDVRDYPCPSGGATTSGSSTFMSAACTSKDNCNDALTSGKNKYTHWDYFVATGEYEKDKKKATNSACSTEATKCTNHIAENCPVEAPEIAGSSMSALTDGAFQAINNADQLIADGNSASSLKTEDPYSGLVSSNAEDGGVKDTIGVSKPTANSGSSPGLSFGNPAGMASNKPSSGGFSGFGANNSKAEASKGKSSFMAEQTDVNPTDMAKFEGAAKGAQGAPFNYHAGDNFGGAGGVENAGFGRDPASASGAVDPSMDDYLANAGPLSLFERVHPHYGKVAREVQLENVKHAIRDASMK